MTVTEFLLARIAEDEAVAEAAATYSAEWHAVDEFNETVVLDLADTQGHTFDSVYGQVAPHIARHDPARVLAECEAKRRIVEFHRNWPVLVERPTEFEPSFGADLSFADQVTFRASKQIAWMTEQEYRNRFGDEPPTAPMLAAMAVVYADHPDYREEWRP